MQALETRYGSVALTAVLRSLQSKSAPVLGSNWGPVEPASGMKPLVRTVFPDLSDWTVQKLSERLRDLGLAESRRQGNRYQVYVRHDVTEVTLEMLTSGGGVPESPIADPNSSDPTGAQVAYAALSGDTASGVDASHIDSIADGGSTAEAPGETYSIELDATVLDPNQGQAADPSEGGESFALPVRPVTREQQRERLRGVFASLVAKIERLEAALSEANGRAADAEAALATQRAAANKPDPALDLMIAEYTPRGTQQE